MKIAYPISIREFTKFVLGSHQAKKLMDGWPLETIQVLDFINEHFNKLGVFKVQPLGKSDLIFNNILFLLKNSPELQNLIKSTRNKMEKDAKNRIYKG